MKEVKLPSGAVLKIQAAPFAVSKATYHAVLEEAKSLPMNRLSDVSSLLKDIMSYGFSSKQIEACFHECLKRCIYDGQKISEDEKEFEPENKRQDYPIVFFEVILENIRPFGKSLYVVLKQVSTMIPKYPA